MRLCGGLFWLALLLCACPVQADLPPPAGVSWPAELQAALKADGFLPDTGATLPPGLIVEGRASPETEAQERTDQGRPGRETLQGFFRQRSSDLSLFCGTTTCRPLSEKQAILRRYFRGNYLRLPNGISATDSVSAAAVYADHAAAYFSDPDYACRRPLTAAVLVSVWQLTPPASPCVGSLPFLVAQEEHPSKLQWVDPARVYAVHLMFAGSTDGGISRFGHVMLRIVHCNPQRAVVDAGCEQDLFDHLVVGFRAGVDDLDLSLWKGLSGGYPVKLYANTFMDSYRNYTIDEFRSVYSLPLRLSPAEKDLLLQGLAEVHWSYQNDYRFFTKNCATELQWLLETVAALTTPGHPLLPEKRYRPDRLFADARAAFGFSGTVLDDLQQAERGGYYFPSAENYYQAAVVAVTAGLTQPGKRAMRAPQDWKARTAAERREQILEPVVNALREQKIKREEVVPAEAMAREKTAAQASVVLEAWVERGLRRQILGNMLLYYGRLLGDIEQRDIFFTTDERALMQSCLASLRDSHRPGSLPVGVPRHGFNEETGRCDTKSPALLAIMKRFYEAFPISERSRSDIAELESTMENIQWVTTALRG